MQPYSDSPKMFVSGKALGLWTAITTPSAIYVEGLVGFLARL
jgi:hypothetical protein